MALTESVITPAAAVSQLVRTFRLNNVRTMNALPNQYNGHIQQDSLQDKELYKSALGTPVFTDLTFDPIFYEVGNNKIVHVPAITLVTVLMSITQPKNIIATPIQGRNGTVKEYIGMGDYQITINGILSGSNGSYPASQVLALKKMLDAPRELIAVSTYLQNLEIFNLTVIDYSFGQEPGGYSQQIFTINCLSDLPVALQIVHV